LVAEKTLSEGIMKMRCGNRKVTDVNAFERLSGTYAERCKKAYLPTGEGMDRIHTIFLPHVANIPTGRIADASFSVNSLVFPLRVVFYDGFSVFAQVSGILSSEYLSRYDFSVI
jgi:hypothetical protein